MNRTKHRANMIRTFNLAVKGGHTSVVFEVPKIEWSKELTLKDLLTYVRNLSNASK